MQEHIKKYPLKIGVSLLSLFLIVGVVLFHTQVVFAAITHDNDSTKVVNGFVGSPTNTWTHTTASGATLGVLTCDLWQDVGGSGTVGSATYDSQSITLVNSTRSGSMYSYIGYIASPHSGTSLTVSVTVAGNIDAFKCAFSTYSGTDTINPIDTSITAVTGSVPYTSVSKAITTGVDNALVIATLSKFGTGALTVGGGQTSIQNDVTGSVSGAAGYQTAGVAGSVTPSWSVASNSNDWSMTVVSFKPAGTGVAIRSKQTWTSENVDQTIPVITTGDCVVFVGQVSDSDNVHRGVDSNPTVGGVSMTNITQSTVGGQNNQVDVDYLKNASSGTNVTFHTAYHAASPAFMGTVYVLSNCDTSTQPSGSNHAESTGAANPSVSLASLNAGDLIIEGISGNNTPTANASQTVNYTGSGNASSFATSVKTASAGTNTESWTMTSAAYAFNTIAIKVASSGGGSAAPAGPNSGVIMMMGNDF